MGLDMSAAGFGVFGARSFGAHALNRAWFAWNFKRLRWRGRRRGASLARPPGLLDLRTEEFYFKFCFCRSGSYIGYSHCGIVQLSS
jgi:hypothetical protein